MQRRNCLSQKELAARWGISHRTLERWRQTGEGPAFLKLGGRVVYRLEDIVEYERSRVQRCSELESPPPRRLTAMPRT